MLAGMDLAFFRVLQNSVRTFQGKISQDTALTVPLPTGQLFWHEMGMPEMAHRCGAHGGGEAVAKAIGGGFLHMRRHAVLRSSYAQRISIAILFSTLLTVSASAQTYKLLDTFTGTNGQNPEYLNLAQGIDGDLYGTTQYGGAYGHGSVFKISTGGTLTTLWSFCKTTNCPDGSNPMAGLTLVPGGNLYGTTAGGGANGYGTIYMVTPAGVESVMHSFNFTDGDDPQTAMTMGIDGNLYGTTLLGGIGGCGGCHGGGVAFKMTPAGVFTKLHDFCTGSCSEGDPGPGDTLAQGTDGNFYMVITGRSGYYDGYFIKMTPKGVVTVLYTFCSLTNCDDGAFPSGPVVQAADGNFYGTTIGGGTFNDGSVFKVTTTGKLTTIHSFDYTTTGNLGADTNAGLILGTDGNLYGTNAFGGQGCVSGCGTLFKMTTAGALTTLYEFAGGSDGAGPWGVAQGTGGAFYGTTPVGGSANDGTAYRVSTGIKPFVRLVTHYGKVGATVDLIGQGFTGATGVSFDGVTATFKNVSDTFLTAVVPTGALTGPVTVTTFTTSYKSSQNYRVVPQLTKVSPTNGIVGSTVTLTGISLTQTSAVTIGGKAATFKVVSDTQVTATVPAAAKTGLSIAVTTAGGSATIGPFAVVPNITSFSPTSGTAGTAITIKGTTFTGTTQIAFGGVDASSFTVINDSQVDATVPSGAQTGPIQITTPGGSGTSTTSFTVN
jgi:uncharacterized repeat protein (TIGR03803 family)